MPSPSTLRRDPPDSGPAERAGGDRASRPGLPAGWAVRANLVCGRSSTPSGPFPARDASGARFPNAFRRLRRPGTILAHGAATGRWNGCRVPCAPVAREPGAARGGADGDRGRQPAGEGHGDGRAFGIRRREAGQGQEAPRHGGRGRVPDHGRGPRGLGAGPGP